MASQWLNTIDRPLFLNQCLNIDELFNGLKQQFDVNYQQQPLGFIKDHKILGLMSPVENTIYIDPVLNEHHTMKRFTQAHEIAHWVLHRKLDLTDYNLADTPQQLNQKRQLITTYDWIEWQANTFAAFILIPHKRFSVAIDKALNQLGIKKSIIKLEYFEYYKLQKILAYWFDVSYSVIGIYYQQYKKTAL
tara:strand:- start:627 stop:1199 length:573 start_codon:yes stop_codon:yes gene_type:complete